MIWSRKDLTEHLGVKSNYISVYEKQNKLIVQNGMIDDELEINKKWIKKQLQNRKKREGYEEPLDENQKKIIDNFDVDTEKKIQEIALLKEKIENEKIKKERQLGKLIPTDLTKSIMALHFQNINVSFYQAVSKVVSVLKKQVGGDKKIFIKIEDQLVDIINASVAESIKQSKKDMINLVNEYSEKSK